MEQQTKSKIVGYLFRLAAVTLFGMSPIVIKYFLGTFNGFAIASIISFIGMVITLPILSYKVLLKKQKYHKSCYSSYFWAALLSNGLTIIFFYISVQFISATNAILILSFAPLVALIFGAIFWTQKPAYLRYRKDTIAMLITFMVGTVGICFIVLNGAKYETGLLGNGIAMLAMLCDVISTLAIILYLKQDHKFEGLDYIIHKATILGLLFSPAALYYLSRVSFNDIEITALLFQAIFPIILAHYCIYEAYKRLDGFVNYLLFNLSIVVTLTLEIVFFELQLSYVLIIGALLVVGASILAEYINTTAEAKSHSM